MQAIEFSAELSGNTLIIPPEIFAALPAFSEARVILLFEEDSEDTIWQQASYVHFLRDDGDEDAIYDA